MTDDAHPTPDGETPQPPHDDSWHKPRIWPRVVGVLILLLGVGGAWIWQNPGLLQGLFAHASGDDTTLKSLEARVARLEQRADPAVLAVRIDALEKRPVPSVDLRPLTARVDALEARSPRAAAGPDLDPIAARLDALERGQAERTTGTGDAWRDDVERQIGGLTTKESSVAATADRAGRMARLGAAEIALASGQPLGTIPDAPPALALYATAAPPSEAALRLAFPAAMQAALKVGVPDTEGKSFLGRILARLQDYRLITVREGDHVVIGNQDGETLAHARTLLDAGDLAAAVRTVETLSGPPAGKMAPWLADAHALLAAREALAALARNG